MRLLLILMLFLLLLLDFSGKASTSELLPSFFAPPVVLFVPSFAPLAPYKEDKTCKKNQSPTSPYFCLTSSSSPFQFPSQLIMLDSYTFFLKCGWIRNLCTANWHRLVSQKKKQRVPHRHPLEFPPPPPSSSSHAAAPDWQAGGKPRPPPAPSRSSRRRG